MVDKKLTKLARTASNVVGEDLWGPKSGLARLDTPERASASRTRDCSQTLDCMTGPHRTIARGTMVSASYHVHPPSPLAWNPR